MMFSMNVEKVRNTKIEDQSDLKPDWRISLLDRLKQVEEQPAIWDNPKDKYYVCIGQ